MRVIGSLVGVGLGILDIIGIVSGFAMSVGQGLAALLVPPYGIFVGLVRILG